MAMHAAATTAPAEAAEAAVKARSQVTRRRHTSSVTGGLSRLNGASWATVATASTSTASSASYAVSGCNGSKPQGTFRPRP
eukprot:CAMPEP_0185556024 /NCGR_PEP_ID=MMETSP1381-20130426/46035_1 /TAXON_ID=298111 /ORGANISM="Pavlova sp., Strain CCMP459" /LENGTH=80 /DNA_ID=CAMNT_0028169379 /DNA_START=48 /DNA_END=286 /DNA_ORIENTATION=+